MRAKDLAARCRRLEELTRGFLKELAIVGECDDPLLYLERLDYLTGVREALAGTERARVALARARQRLEEQGQA
jgi:hypothetical protein